MKEPALYAQRLGFSPPQQVSNVKLSIFISTPKSESQPMTTESKSLTLI